jgi:hypothetical protein
MRFTRVVLLSALIAVGCEVKKTDSLPPSPSPSSGPSSTSGKDGTGNTNAPVTGMIKGKPFTPETVTLQGRELRFRVGKDFFADAEVFFTLPGEDAEKLEAKEWKFNGDFGAPIVVAGTGKPGEGFPEHVFGQDHTMTVRITKLTPDSVEGFIDFRATKLANTYLVGTFKGKREKSGHEPLESDDSPYVHGKIQLTGDWKEESFAAGFAGKGADGKPHSNATGTTFKPGGGGGASCTTFKPQITTIFDKDGIQYRHTKVPPGDYLVFVEKGGILAAWKKVTVKPGDQLTVDLTVDLANVGSLVITLPEDEANDTFEARLELYPEGVEVPGGGRPLTFGAAEVKKGRKTVTVKNVPVGKYLVIRGKSEATVEVTKGKEATVALVRKGPNG